LGGFVHNATDDGPLYEFNGEIMEICPGLEVRKVKIQE
jgi:hypothetical protein